MNRYKLLLVVLSLLSSSSTHPDECSHNRCLVTSPSGSYVGLSNSSTLVPNCYYCSYTDIPYAVAPRFGKPKPVKSLGPHIYDATQDNIKCVQPLSHRNNMTTVGTEDCLYLNVFSPQTNGNTVKRPLKAVIVFIHGGGYESGSNSAKEFYSPGYFMPQDIVLVVINYRLGAFGFLNLGIPECGGNMGLRDQMEALKWIQKNIEWFGGDPGRVTVMGESAGGVSAYLLPFSPLARGLITSGIIVQSPLYTDRPSYDILLRATTQYYSILFAKFLGYKSDPNNRYAILNFFRRFTALDLVRGYTKFMEYLIKTDDMVYKKRPFVASVDRYIPDAVFPGTLEELSRNFPNISIIYGGNNADGDHNSFTDPRTVANYISTHLGLYLRGSNPIYAKNRQTLEKSIAMVKKYYNPDGRDNQIDVSVKVETYFSYDNVYTKQIPIFRVPYQSNKIWLYEFQFDSGDHGFKKFFLGQYADWVQGASHAQELEYLFYPPIFFPNGLRVTQEELNLICRMTTWWANFAKTGDPNRGSTNHARTDVIWGPTTPTHDNYLQIGVGNTSHALFVKNQKIFQKQRDFFQRLLEFALKN